MTDPDFNAITSAAFRADPHPILARMRAHHPVLHLSPGLIESWHIFRYHDVRAVLLDTETFSSDRGLVGGGQLSDANLGFLFNNMISATGDKHRRLRMIGNRVFMPKYVESFRPMVQSLVDERMDFALSGEKFDLVEDFAAEITVAMVCAILGAPRAARRQRPDSPLVGGVGRKLRGLHLAGGGKPRTGRKRPPDRHRPDRLFP